MSKYSDGILAFHCPRWNELPSIELYMDQVVKIIEDSLVALDFTNETRAITRTMINNYVKQRLITAPVRKKYRKGQLAMLIVISTLKRCFSISEISDMTTIILKKYENQAAYDLFCSELENALHAAFIPDYTPQSQDDGSPEFNTVKAVMKAFSNKIYAQNVVSEFNAQP